VGYLYMTLLQISYESNDERILKIGQYFVKLWARDCFLTHSVDLSYRIEDKNTILVTANCRHHHCLAQGPLLASRAFINQSINHLIRARPTKHTHTHTRTLKKDIKTDRAQRTAYTSSNISADPTFRALSCVLGDCTHQ